MNQKQKQGYNIITSLAEILDEKDILSKEIVNRLSSFHVWSDEYIDERINWMPEKPIKAAFLRTYKIPEIEISLKQFSLFLNQLHNISLVNLLLVFFLLVHFFFMLCQAGLDSLH